MAVVWHDHLLSDCKYWYQSQLLWHRSPYKLHHSDTIEFPEAKTTALIFVPEANATALIVVLRL